MGNVIRKNVSFQPDDYAAVEAECKDSGLPFSTQLGLIIREWAEIRQLLLVGRALDAELISAEDAAERLATMARAG